MVKKAKWLKNVKKAFSPDLKKLKHQSVECQDSVISYPVLVATSRSSPPQFEVRVDEVNYDEHKKNLCLPLPDSVSATDEDSPTDSPPSSPEFVGRAITDRFAGKSKEEAATILIQTTFRGYLARRESRGMRLLARLKLFMEGSGVQRQAAKTLKCMQSLTRVQSQIQSRRIRMSEVNQARHKQLVQKHAKELGGLKNGSNWNISNQSKEQVEAGLLNKYEAAMRRERAMAYAFTHQQNLKSNSKSTNPTFMDHSNPTWGWSWMERWMPDQPCESSEKEQNKNINSLPKNSTKHSSHGSGETAKFSSNRKNLSTSNQPNTSSSSSTTTKNPRKNRPTPPFVRSKTTDEIAKNSEKNRRQLIARSSVSDDESLASSKSRRINTVPTKPARSKLNVKAQTTTTTTTTEDNNNGVSTEKAPAKKRLSTSASPAPKPRRSSAPPKVENGVVKAVKTRP
ncbi:unnamed protein product [Cochlearia groenlandica]